MLRDPISGDYWSAQFKYIEINLVPCNYKRFPEEEIPAECSGDLEAMQKFVERTVVSALANKGRLNPDDFYEDSVIRESTLLQSQFDP